MERVIGTAVISIFGWILSNRYVVPYIIKFWNWIRKKQKEYEDENIDTSREILEIKAHSLEVYESQITFLMGQIDKLENQIKEHYTQLYNMRKMVLELNIKLFGQYVVIAKLKEMCCADEVCLNRIRCTDENCPDIACMSENNV